MSKNGHFQKVRRPTGLEVYNDAAKILEDFLEKRIDRNLKGTARQRRNQTDPTQKKNLVGRTSVDISVTRCKTMPSRYRGSIEDELKQKDLENLEEKKHKKKAKIGIESESSANETEVESDADDNSYIKNRKKKSLFKRAKENLVRSFHRDQKDGFGKKEEKEKDSHSNKKRKLRKKTDKDEVVSESKRSVKGHLNKDKSIDYTEVIDYHRSDPSSRTDSHSHKSRSGSMSRSSLLDAIRKPFRKSLHKKDSGEYENKTKSYSENGGKSLSFKDDDTSASPRSTSSPRHESTTPSSPPPTHHSVALNVRSVNEEDELRDSHVIHGGKGGTLSSVTSSHYPTSDYNNSVGSLNVLPSVHSSVLDSPGDDIEFIDADEKEKRKSLIKYHGSEGLLNLQWLADQTANAKAFDFQVDEHSVSTRRQDGQLETTTVVTATRTVVIEEEDEDGEKTQQDDHDGNGQDNSKTAPEKEELYGKIAQKLIEMADTYGGNLSEAERELEDGAATTSDAPLTDLEKEIIACLRSGGDKYGKKMEDQLDAMKAAVTEEAYDRFRSTINNSMGHELSWNTLALLFYATKGVVSAVGKSSQVAVQAKEFTLKYISDTFVSWIMEQGGFDSMLSASETDPELD